MNKKSKVPKNAFQFNVLTSVVKSFARIVKIVNWVHVVELGYLTDIKDDVGLNPPN